MLKCSIQTTISRIPGDENLFDEYVEDSKDGVKRKVDKGGLWAPQSEEVHIFF